MEIKLIILPKQTIVVSDEEIKVGDLYFDGVDLIHTKSQYNNSLVNGNKDARKIIAGLKGLPSINFNGSFDIDVDFEMKAEGCKAYKCNHYLDPEEWTCDSPGCESDCEKLEWIPKIENNQITILKKL